MGNVTRLGDVGGRIVAEVNLELLRQDPTSFINGNDWRPELAVNGVVKIANLLKHAGVV
jgi:hypothetical protein